jgi:MinD-like ATPase involved in chromosome partitioning or flagellar assembly/uncharacterized protein involved in exopolysaccharide biosynthesis
MNPAKHRNWLLTILQLRAPIIILALFGLVLIVALLTYAFTPIYSASTILAIDDEVSRVLSGVNTSFPATSSNDFIRYEWFASHSVQLMRMPQFAEKIIKKEGLRGKSGRALYPEYFVEPSLFNLIFINQGQGISVEWVADTQTFMISGYSRDPDMAVTLSKEYSDAFLEENANQFRGPALKLLDRVKIQMQDLSDKIEGVDQELRDTRKKYRTADPEEEITALTAKINSIKSQIEGEQANETLYATRMEYYKQQEDTFAKLKRVDEYFENNSSIDTIKSEIRQLQGTLVWQSIDLTPDNPNYRQTQKKLDFAQQQLKDEASKRFAQESVRVHPLLDTMTQMLINLRLAHLSSELQIDFFTKLLAAMENRRTELLLANTGIINGHLKRETMASTLQLALKDQYRLENLLQRPVAFFRVISDSRINKDNLGEYKHFPKKKKIVIIAALFAGFLLVFFFIGKEMVDDRVYYGWQLDGMKKTFDCIDLPHFDQHGLGQNPENIYRYIQDICTSLRDSRIVRVSSRYSGEGKTTIAGALAWYYRRIGTVTIIVDGDIVKRSLSRNFGAGDKPGLLDILSGAKQLCDCIVEVAPGIYLLPAGGSSDPVFGVEKFKEVFSQLAISHDRIIYIDPPFDASFSILSEGMPQNDTIMVVQSGKHSVVELEQVGKMRRFNNEISTLKWIVINKIPRAINFFSIRDLFVFVVHPIRTAKILS